MKQAQKRLIAVSLVIIFLLGIVVGWWVQYQKHGKYAECFNALYVMTLVKLRYYQPISAGELWQTYWKTGSIPEMLKTLNDPYTRFLNRQEYLELTKETKGSFGGIGVYLATKDGKIIISEVVKNSPSERAGLQKGDQIIKVDRYLVSKVSSEFAIAKIRGLVGTQLSLSVMRKSGVKLARVDVNLRREVILLPTVEAEIKADPEMGKYAYLKIFSFAETTPLDLDRELKKIDRMSSCQGIILDLRSNPGGSLEAAVKVVSQFIAEGVPVLHIKRRGFPLQSLNAEKYTHRKLPMVVLIDAWSASAAEIVSGALKDRHRALLVGTNTYGKDLIQEIRPLPGGVAITITIASYLTSGKVNIHKKGVTPDKVVEIPGAMENMLKGDSRAYLEVQQAQDREALLLLRAEVANLKKAI